MESEYLLSIILERFKEKGMAKVDNYNSFGYVRETPKSVIVTREKGKDTPVPHIKIIKGIDAYKNKPDLYDEGPGALREFDITHVTSPVWSLLHLLKKEEYKF